ncbi:hypothetical protein SDC9_184869 [bioreactor metagenome]|uniref:Uncharacterized protein n=1 Tax=bioreactor metagenome TaxID=1076179 RepID=A0A645HG45_9ZZZZ
MLETAFNSIFDRYGGPVLEHDEKVSLLHKEAEHIARANFENDARRERESVESIKEAI